MALARCAGVVFVSLAVACSGGGDDSPAPTFTVSGTIDAAPATLVDGDNGDSNPATPQIANDSPATAQPLPSPVTVGGWASIGSDPQDWYRITLGTDQVVTLWTADTATTADLDLCVFDVGDASAPIDCVTGAGAIARYTVAAPGEYFLRVQAAALSSNYVLAVGPVGPMPAGPVAPASAALAAGLPEPDLDPLAAEGEFVPGEVIVRFEEAPGARSAMGLAARAAALGLVPLAGDPRHEVLLGLGGPADRARAFGVLGIGPAPASADAVRAAKADTIRVVNALRRHAGVAAAGLNRIMRASLVPNDQHYGLQWHYPLINLPAAWERTTGTPSSGDVIVAVVDSGVYLAHPDLQGKFATNGSGVIQGYDFVLDPVSAQDNDGPDPNPDDPGDHPGVPVPPEQASIFHGTHVAGTVGALTNNGPNGGVAGVSWGARIMPVRVLGRFGIGTSFDVLQGIRWAAGLLSSPPPPARRADIINLSLGCTPLTDPSCVPQQVEQKVFDDARAAGVIVVAAAGNENTSQRGLPASYAGVISVSAVDRNRARAPYSNFGATVDIAAPGGVITTPTGEGGIASTLADDRTGTRQPIYAFLQGTSMAAPHVAGVVALMKAVCPSLQPAQLDAILATPDGMTDDLGSPERDDTFGRGLVNAAKAVLSAESRCDVPALEVLPKRIDLALGSGPATITVSKSGLGALAVSSVTQDVPWLEVAAGPVDGSGLGPYTVSVKRGALGPGVHLGTITFTTTPLQTVTVPVTVQVGGTVVGPPSAGHLYVVLLREARPGVFENVAQVDLEPAAGKYPFSFGGVPLGLYIVVATTDHDDDLQLCDDGEACGAYPSAGDATFISVTSDVGAIDFAAGFDATFGGVASGAVPSKAAKLTSRPASAGVRK